MVFIAGTAGNDSAFTMNTNSTGIGVGIPPVGQSTIPSERVSRVE